MKRKTLSSEVEQPATPYSQAKHLAQGLMGAYNAELNRQELDPTGHASHFKLRLLGAASTAQAYSASFHGPDDQVVETLYIGNFLTQ